MSAIDQLAQCLRHLRRRFEIELPVDTDDVCVVRGRNGYVKIQDQSPSVVRVTMLRSTLYVVWLYEFRSPPPAIRR